ncbi:MAG: lasso peptide biosynthesis B2 protein [Leadbetterella sp.]
MHKFFDLSFSQKISCLQVLICLLVIKSSLFFFSFSFFKKLYTKLLKFPFGSQLDQLHTVKLVYLVKGVSNRIPLGFTCVPQALCLKFFLRKDPEAKVVIGVSLRNGFMGHAWVEKEGQYLIGEIPNEVYQPIWNWV